MLDAARDSGVGQTVHVGGHQGRRDGGVVAEGAGADHDVVGVGVDVRHGGEVDVETEALQIGADGTGRFPDRIRTRCGEDGGTLETGHVESRIPGNPAHPATFFIDAQQGGARQCAQVPDEAHQLLRIRDVVPVEQDAARGIQVCPAAHAVADGLQAVGRQLRIGVVTDRRFQRFRTDHKQLPDLFPER